jgi:hypothetical protein
MDIPTLLRDGIEEKMSQFRLICAEPISDIFLCNTRSGFGDAKTARIWLFTTNLACEVMGVGPETTVSMTSHDSVSRATLQIRNFDLLVANKDSAVDLAISYRFGGESALTARGYNCPDLLNVFRTYFAKHLAPGDGLEMKTLGGERATP